MKPQRAVTGYCSTVAAVPNKSVQAFSHPIRNISQLGQAVSVSCSRSCFMRGVILILEPMQSTVEMEKSVAVFTFKQHLCITMPYVPFY